MIDLVVLIATISEVLYSSKTKKLLEMQLKAFPRDKKAFNRWEKRDKWTVWFHAGGCCIVAYTIHELLKKAGIRSKVVALEEVVGPFRQYKHEIVKVGDLVIEPGVSSLEIMTSQKYKSLIPADWKEVKSKKPSAGARNGLAFCHPKIVKLLVKHIETNRG